MWFKRKTKNRRAWRSHSVLDVKLRSSQVRAARTRLVAIALGVSVGTVVGLFVLWRAGEWTLNRCVYENKSFAIREFDVRSDGVIAAEQLQRWSGVRPGENLMALDLGRVKRALEMEPAIQSVSVERILPATLRIRVVEREPVAQINIPRPRAGGGIELVVYQLDADGCVMLPLDPRQRAVPLDQASDQLPVISGINVSLLQPGRRVDTAQTQAALRFIAAFEGSPLAGVVDLKRVDVSMPAVLIVTTGQGSEVTFGLDNLDRQLARWSKVHEECARLNRVIASLDLAVPDNPPLRLVEAGNPLPPSPKNLKPPKSKKKNV